MKVSEGVAKALEQAGVERMFGVMGYANMSTVATYRDDNPTAYVAAAHEAGAIAMADGYSRLAGRLGVAAVTHGPGVTNGLTALTEAVRARSSLVLLTGSTPPLQRDHNQWLDLRAAAHLTGAAYWQVETPASAMDDVARALRFAAARRQAVLLDVPARLLLEEIDAPTSVLGFDAGRPAACAPGSEERDRAVGLIAAANRPVLLVGQGAVFAGARDELLRLAQVLHAPVATTVQALNYLEPYPLDLGIFGSESHSLAVKYISESDCIISVGAALNHFTTSRGDLLRGKRLVQCDIDPAALGSTQPANVSVLSDVREFARCVADDLESLGETPESSWVTQLRADLAGFDPTNEYTDKSTSTAVDIRTAMHALDQVLPRERAVVTDIGYFKTAPWRYLRCRSGAFAQSGSFGAVGLGLQMAVGASFADQDRITVAVVGDGGLMMGLSELATAVAHRRRLVIAVANDSCYNAEYQELQELGHNPDYSLLNVPPFADVARAFGARGEVITSVADIERVGPTLQDIDGPVVLDIKLDPIDSQRYR